MASSIISLLTHTAILIENELAGKNTGFYVDKATGNYDTDKLFLITNKHSHLVYLLQRRMSLMF